MQKSNNKFIFIKLFVIIFCFQGLVSTQEQNMLNITSGDLATQVDMFRGNFSVFDVVESNIDFSSFLFGGGAVPSSYIRVFVDGKSQTLDQMEAIYPLGVSLGSQIDGIFLAGPNKDVYVEVALFAMDITEGSDRNTLGIAISLSNISRAQRRNVGVKIMLDTDIGENRNEPLVYLPTGQRITNAFIFEQTNMPPYLFFGQKDRGVQAPKGKGFYVYPFLTTNIPSIMTVANWRRVSDDQWSSLSVDPSFSYTSSTSKDVGIAIFYGFYDLAPNQVENVGSAISKNISTLWPVIEQKAIDEGVFNPQRFEIEEMFQDVVKQGIPQQIQKNHENVEELLVEYNTITGNSQKRKDFRKKILGFEVIETTTPQKNPEETTYIRYANDSMWNYLFQVNLKIDRVEQTIDQALNFKIKEEFFDTPPARGITKQQYYSITN